LPGNDESQTIDALTQKLAELKEQRSSDGNNADQRAERRDKLNELVRTLWEEIEKLRTTRDDLNEQVRKLKQQRSEAASRIREKMEESKAISQEKRMMTEDKPSRSYPSLKKELEDIEWKVQTTSHTLQEDKEMMAQVKQLETQLGVYRKIEKASQKTSELHNQINTLKNENEIRHKKLTTLAQRSQELHKSMLEKIGEVKMKRKEADEMHKEFLAARMKTKTLQDEIHTVSAQIMQLKKSLHETEQKQRKESEDTLRQAIEKQAREKLKRREKLSWEEFQLLAEKEMTSQD
jgi:uncharacterized coiled-coil DUF342 family protein